MRSERGEGPRPHLGGPDAVGVVRLVAIGVHGGRVVVQLGARQHGQRVAQSGKLLAHIHVHMDVHTLHLPLHVQNPLGIFWNGRDRLGYIHSDTLDTFHLI